jgi:hypothetical protein
MRGDGQAHLHWRIYQPTRLSLESPKTIPKTRDTTDFWSVLNEETDTVIFAGPGHGKTTLLHWVYYKLFQDKSWFPLLYTLRWPNAVADLEEFVRELGNSKAHQRLRKTRIVLLVDGYDEISLEERKLVSAALREFSNLKLGNYYLACRTFYDIIDLKARYYYIDDFNEFFANVGYGRSQAAIL